MKQEKITCQCHNSIKLKIIEFIGRNDQCYIIEDAVEKIYGIVKNEIKEDMEIEEAFLKTYIRGLITDLINDKLLRVKEIKYDKEKEKEKEYYYMKLVQPIESIFGKEDEKKIIGRSKEVSKEKKEDNVKERGESNKKKKIEEYILLKKKLEKMRKESKGQTMIKVLHKYNELKDIAQELLGRIATHRNISIKELYEELDISDEEE